MLKMISSITRTNPMKMKTPIDTSGSSEMDETERKLLLGGVLEPMRKHNALNILQN